MGRGLAERAAIVQHPGGPCRCPPGRVPGVPSAAVAVAAEGSHATCTDPAHAAPHACARTTHACATAALRSPATPCHPVSPWGSCPHPPGSWMQSGRILAPSNPSAPHNPTADHQALPTSTGLNTCGRGRRGLPTWTPKCGGRGWPGRGCRAQQELPGDRHCLPERPQPHAELVTGLIPGSAAPRLCLEVVGGPRASLAHGPVLAPTLHSPHASEPHTHTRPPAAPPVGYHCLYGAAKQCWVPQPPPTCTEHTRAGTHTQVPAPPSQHRVCVGSPARRAPHVCGHNQGVTVLARPSTLWQGSEVVAV